MRGCSEPDIWSYSQILCIKRARGSEWPQETLCGLPEQQDPVPSWSLCLPGGRGVVPVPGNRSDPNSSVTSVPSQSSHLPGLCCRAVNENLLLPGAAPQTPALEMFLLGFLPISIDFQGKELTLGNMSPVNLRACSQQGHICRWGK